MQALAASSPLDAHQNAGDQHKQGRGDEHDRVDGEPVLGLIACAHGDSNSKLNVGGLDGEILSGLCFRYDALTLGELRCGYS